MHKSDVLHMMGLQFLFSREGVRGRAIKDLHDLRYASLDM